MSISNIILFITLSIIFLTTDRSKTHMAFLLGGYTYFLLSAGIDYVISLIFTKKETDAKLKE